MLGRNGRNRGCTSCAKGLTGAKLRKWCGMGRRSGIGGSAFGALVLVGFIAWVLSQIWAYLLVGVAIALGTWITWMITRNLRSGAAPRMVAVDAPRTAPAPIQQYSSLEPIDRAVFDDTVMAEAAALKVFNTWMRQLPAAPADGSELVRSLELRTRHIGRLVSEVAHRKVVWREAPYSGSEPVTAPRVHPEAVDPWATDEEELKQTSRYIASCERCTSDGTVTCGACRGTTQVQCSACNGAGKAYGYASNGSRRLMNCKTCRGKKELKCTGCEGGKVTCSACHGNGCSERWLEMEEFQRGDVQVEPDGDVTRAYRWGTDGVVASRQEVEADAKILEEIAAEGPLSPEILASKIPNIWLERHWRKIQPKLQIGERVRAQSFLLLEVPTVEVAYSLPGKTPTVISFEGCRMLAPPPSLDPFLVARAERLRLARYALAGLSLIVPIAYLFRGAYFRTGWVLGLSISVVALAALVYAFAHEATLGRRTAKRWGFSALVAATAACAFAIGAEPSVRDAQRYIARGKLTEARTELTALGHAEDGRHAQLWADLHLAEVLKTQDVAVAASEAARISLDHPQRVIANRHLLGLVSGSVATLLSQHQPDRAAATLEKATSVLAALPTADLKELQARVADESYVQCSTEACRWKAALDAYHLARTTARARRLSEARAKVIAALGGRPKTDEPVLARLERLDATITLSEAVEGETQEDTELKAKAHEATEWVRAERGKIPILGAEREVAATLFGVPANKGTPTIGSRRDGVAVLCAMRGERCVGVYIAALSSAVALNDPRHAESTTAVLAQAVGSKVRMPEPPQPRGGTAPTSSRWREAGTPITARWCGQDLVELRVGNAEP